MRSQWVFGAAFLALASLSTIACTAVETERSLTTAQAIDRKKGGSSGTPGTSGSNPDPGTSNPDDPTSPGTPIGPSQPIPSGQPIPPSLPIGPGTAPETPTKVPVVPTPVYGGDPPATISLTTPVFRVQPPDMPLLPHPSPFFTPDRYGLPWADFHDHDALYVATDRDALEKLRTDQGYFDQGMVMVETTVGKLIEAATKAGFTEVRVVYDGGWAVSQEGDAFIIVGVPPNKN